MVYLGAAVLSEFLNTVFSSCDEGCVWYKHPSSATLSNEGFSLWLSEIHHNSDDKACLCEIENRFEMTISAIHTRGCVSKLMRVLWLIFHSYIP